MSVSRFDPALNWNLILSPISPQWFMLPLAKLSPINLQRLDKCEIKCQPTLSLKNKKSAF